MLRIALLSALLLSPVLATAQTAAPPPGYHYQKRPDVLVPSPDPGGPADRTAPVMPGDLVQPDESVAQPTRAERLDRMFERLRTADSKARAEDIAGNIERLWLDSGSPTIDLLMRQAGRAIRRKDYGEALDLLDAVVRLKPDFAEGWDRRATVEYLTDDYGHAISDIEHTLALEPRQWGAISGLAIILAEMDKPSQAIAMIDRALAIDPFLDTLKDKRKELAAKLGKTPI